MKRSTGGWVLAAACAAATAYGASREVTVSFLKAAAGSLAEGERVTFTALYDGSKGMREATGPYMRAKGFSRFQVIDPELKTVFDSVYCEQRSAAFDTLVAVGGQKLIAFSGYRSRGETKEDAVVVTEAEAATTPGSQSGDAPAAARGPMTFRVVLTDLATSNRTVLVNVETGKLYRVFSTGLLIEAEPNDAGRVQVLQGR